MKRKHICPECNQIFTRFWNFKRHLINIHPEKFGYWDVKSDESTEQESQYAFPFRKSNVNESSEKSGNFEDYVRRKMVDLLLQEIKAATFDPNLVSNTNVPYEIQTIKNEIQTIKSILLRNNRF